MTEQEIGWLIGLDNRIGLIADVARAYGASLPETEDDDPNRKGGRTNN